MAGEEAETQPEGQRWDSIEGMQLGMERVIQGEGEDGKYSIV